MPGLLLSKSRLTSMGDSYVVTGAWLNFWFPIVIPHPHHPSSIVLLAQSLMKPPELHAFGPIGGAGRSEYARL
jgi:hypothetical protein